VKLLVLGCGYTGTKLAERVLAKGGSVIGTVRSEARAPYIRAVPALTAELVGGLEGDLVVCAFPPDGVTDARIAPALSGRRVVYLSTTAVYGDARHIDHTTPVAPDTERARRRLEAERLHRGATILRCPAIYGPERGLHVRVREGKHRIPGDGTQHVSRIHVDDLVSCILAAKPGTFVIGDRNPAPHLEVVKFVCEKYGVPLPPFVPLDQVDETLRHDRQVDSRHALATLGVTLRYPSYRDGM
jgi:nucleoside-diphosphate-sugar epimerase